MPMAGFPTTGYPSTPQPGYPGYPQQNAGYPQQTAGYPQQNAGYPQQSSGYSQPSSGYPQAAAQGYPSYPNPTSGYPQPNETGAYSQQQPQGYPQQSYPQSQGYEGYPPHNTTSPPQGGYYAPAANSITMPVVSFFQLVFFLFYVLSLKLCTTQSKYEWETFLTARTNFRLICHTKMFVVIPT